MVNEYILSIQDGEVFRIYAPNEKVAINTFKNACRIYSDTKNEEYKKYWNNLCELVNQRKYTLIKVDDFIGIRKLQI